MVLARKAVVYVRQSSQTQVQINLESQRRQYELADLARHHGFRNVEVIDDDYAGFGPGGLMEDLKLGLGTVLPNHSAFTRIAIVTDKDWVARTLHAISWLVPGELSVFGLDEIDRAKQWASG